MHVKGERWRTDDGQEVIVTWDLANDFIRVLTKHGTLKVIHENNLKERLPDGVA